MILVTGAAGFVGRRVVSELASRGQTVRALVRTPSTASVLGESGAELVMGDLLNADSLRDACEGVERVVHLAAVIREQGDRTFRRVNYDGTVNLLEAATAAGVQRIVYASTIGASSEPELPYLYSRWMAEQEVVRSTLAHTMVRFSAGFGEGDEFFNVLAAQVKLFPLVPVAGDGSARFQPIAVEDVARCLVAAVEREDMAGQTIEVGGPEHYTYDEILDLIAETIGAKIVKVHVPPALMKPPIGFLETVTPRSPVTLEQLKMLNIDNVTSADSVQTAFGFTPRSLRDGLGYVRKLSLRDALKINLGFMPRHIRDH